MNYFVSSHVCFLLSVCKFLLKNHCLEITFFCLLCLSHFALNMQKASLVIHNLLNVAEELQLSRMEIPNLVQGKFESPSGDRFFLLSLFLLGGTS